MIIPAYNSLLSTAYWRLFMFIELILLLGLRSSLYSKYVDAVIPWNNTTEQLVKFSHRWKLRDQTPQVFAEKTDCIPSCNDAYTFFKEKDGIFLICYPENG